MRNASDADLIRRAAEEASESGSKRHLPARGKTGCHADHVLLGDEAFGETLRILLHELVRVGGVFCVAIEGNDARVGFADAGESASVSFAGGDHVALIVVDGRISRGSSIIWGGQ